MFAGRIVLESQTVASMGDAARDILVTAGQVALALASCQLAQLWVGKVGGGLW